VRHDRLVRRFCSAVALFALLAVALASPARSALFLLFSPTTASAGEIVSVRLGGTPAGFTAADRRVPLQRAVRIYLAPAAIAGQVRSRFDPRIHFVGSLVPDRDAHGRLVFEAPPLDSGTYVAAAWCPGCASFRRGQRFFVLAPARSSPYRDEMTLRLELPSAATACPVSTGRVGNGILSSSAPGPDGVLATRRDPDATLFQKLAWLPKRGFHGNLVVRGERLDAPGEMKVISVNWGHSSTGRGSWASAVAFPSEGCWRLSGRVGDVRLTYVVRVVAGCGDTYTPPPCGRTARSRR
jgi:hypothetical protein